MRFVWAMDLAKLPQRIVVGVDFSDLSDGAFSQGFLIASAAALGELHLVSIVDRAALDAAGAVPAAPERGCDAAALIAGAAQRFTAAISASGSVTLTPS